MMAKASRNSGATAGRGRTAAMPAVVDRATFEAELAALRVREKAHSREGDAIAAARRRLPMVEMDAKTPLIGPHGPVRLLDVFEGRQQLVAYYFMWNPGGTAAEQCEGCTLYTDQVREKSFLHSRGVTFAVLCQGPFDESFRYRNFMGWDVPWYSAEQSVQVLLAGRQVGMMHLVSYLRRDDRVFETWWTTMRGVELMGNNYAMLDVTAYGRQEMWEDSPPGWPQTLYVEGDSYRIKGRPISQWPRLAAGYSDDLGSAGS
jgi:predicted dithiol-disulfide oxidoreductase (DUF899 family)